MTETDLTKRFSRAMDLYEAGKKEKAISEMERLYRDYPGFEAVCEHSLRAYNHAMSAQIDEAIAEFTQAIGSTYSLPVLYFYRGLCYYQKLKIAATEMASKSFWDGSASVVRTWPREHNDLLGRAISDIQTYLKARPEKRRRQMAEKILEPLMALSGV